MTSNKEQDTIEVLGGQGSITLLDWLGGDLTTVNAARVSFGGRKEEFDSRDKKLVKYLADNKHYSPFRHNYFQFHFLAPEYVARQAWRHCVGIEGTAENKNVDSPWNEASQRYCVLEDNFYSPDEFRKQSKDNKQASTRELVENQELAKKKYDDALSYCFLRYKELLDMGVCKEQARGVMPISAMTQWYWTLSLQAVHNFILLRDHDHAQWEIREYAVAMKKLVEKVAPVSLAALLSAK